MWCRLAPTLGLAILYASAAQAAQLVAFEREGCVYCQRFETEVGEIYGKTEEAKRATLRRVDIGATRPQDLRDVEVGAFTPTFVLIDAGQEKGRIRGYPGDDAFWSLLDAMLRQVGPAAAPADSH